MDKAGIQKKKRGVKFAALCLLTMRQHVCGGMGSATASRRECERLLAIGQHCGCGDQHAGEVLPPNWSVIVLVLVAVITAVWIGVLGFGLMRLIEHVF